MTPKRRAINLSWFFICLCVSKSLLIKCLKQDILGTFKPEKSPGDDGFTWEFYNCFFDLLGRDLVDSFNSAYFMNHTFSFVLQHPLFNLHTS